MLRRVLLVAVCALALTSLAAVRAEEEWVEPAFIESLDELQAVSPDEPIAPAAAAARAWNKPEAGEQHLAPVAYFHDEHEPHSLVESQMAAEAAVDAAMLATVTAHGKSQAELEAEIEARGPALWAEWKARFGKYVSDEAFRFKTFLANLLRIASLNAKAFFSKVPKALRAVYSHLTEFAAMTAAEFKAILGANPKGAPALKIAPPAPKRVLVKKPSKATFKAAPLKTTADAKSRTPKAKKGKSFLEIEAEADQEPRTIVEANVAGATTPSGPIDCDFREYGSPIVSQGKCGSCYAFATKAVLESTWMLKTAEKVVVSPQQLMDCFRPTMGCKGGNPTGALRWWMTSGGAALESEVPYKAAPSNGTCIKPASANPPKPKDVQYALEPCRSESACQTRDENELGHQLSSNGPLVLIMDASAYQFYKGGVMASDAPCSKDPAKGNHALSLEGLGTDKATGQRFWIVRNSWGPQWGESGRLRMAFGSNVCGLANTPTKVIM